MKDTGERLIPSESKDSVVYGEHMSRYLAVVDMVKGKDILDIASGTGYGTQLLAEYANKVTGVDYSDEAVAYAQENYPAKNLKYQVGDAHTLENIPDNSMDVIISMETIEHLTKPEQFIKQVKRILKPNGIFAVSTPNDEEYREGNDFHVHEFTLTELKKLMKKYFKQIDYYYQGNALAATMFNETDFREEFTRDILVQKTISVDPKKAIYFIAIATSGSEVPTLTSNIAVSQHWNTKGFIEWDKAREGHIVTLEKRAISLRAHIDIVESDHQSMQEQLKHLKLSTAWKITVVLIRFYNIFRYPRTSIRKMHNKLFKRTA
jgi:2-polyprenyl-3-methyl-5-hydroxy-6-metoxy-1,4-benzoquinol methylase